MTPAGVRQVLSAFIDGTDGPYDWGDFITSRLSDPALDSIRDRCAGLREEFPPETPSAFCSAQGIRLIEQFIADLDGCDIESRHD
jgi:hypothetical protein